MVHLVSQDLSVAGQRKGLKHEDNGDEETTRSGLFFEAIRVIREMRERDRRNGRTGYLVRPRFIVFENVPGLFSSNKGEDFKTVITEIVKLSENEAPDLPVPDKGRWTKAGCIYDEMGRWSIAWRVHDAQFWGVPQRRKRIALVTDFGGLSAPEILFERKGMSWHPAESRTEREGTAGATEDSVGETGEHEVLVKEPIPIHDKATRYKGGGDTRHNDGAANGLGIGRAGDPSPTLSAGDRHSVLCLNDQGGQILDVTTDKTGTLRAQEHGHQPIVFEPGAASRIGGHVYADGVTGTIRANAGDNQQAVGFEKEKAGTLEAGKIKHVLIERGSEKNIKSGGQHGDGENICDSGSSDT